MSRVDPATKAQERDPFWLDLKYFCQEFYYRSLSIKNFWGKKVIHYEYDLH